MLDDVLLASRQFRPWRFLSIPLPIYATGIALLLYVSAGGATFSDVVEFVSDVLDVFPELAVLGVALSEDGSLGQDEDRKAAAKAGYEKEQAAQPRRPVL